MEGRQFDSVNNIFRFDRDEVEEWAVAESNCALLISIL